MRKRLAFIGRFLGLFGLLIVLGWATGGLTRFAAALGTAAAVTSPLVNGWTLESRAVGAGAPQHWFRRGTAELRLRLSLDALALGLLPLLSLLGATPGLGARGLAGRAAAGVAWLFALDLFVLLVYPYLVTQRNAFTDIAGTFLGLLTFVGGPVIIWFVLTYDRLRPVWHLR